MTFSRKSKIVLGTFIAGFVFLVGIIWMIGAALCAPRPKQMGTLPSDLHGEKVTFQSTSGSEIHGWLIRGKQDTIILMHGVRGNRADMLDRARFLHQAGYSVLLFDFQAHGESSGKNITFGYLESRDAIAAVEFVRQQSPNEKIGVIGGSLGGAAAILAEPALAVDALVLEMVYPTIEEAVSDRLAIRFGAVGRWLTPLLTCQLQPRVGCSVNDLRPVEKVRTVTTPKLFIAGSEDRHTTIAESKRLFEAAAKPKEFWEINGATHQDLHAYAKGDYEDRVLDFFQRHLNSEQAGGLK